MAKKTLTTNKPADKSEKKKTGSGKKDIKNDLDALFKKNKSSKKIKKEAKPAKVAEKPAKKEKVSMDAPKSKGNKYTKEGYKIYTADELKIGQGGDTPDCPFDCECCF